VEWYERVQQRPAINGSHVIKIERKMCVDGFSVEVEPELETTTVDDTLLADETTLSRLIRVRFNIYQHYASLSIPPDWRPTIAISLSYAA
jgi:hypothetical protein